MFHTLTMFFHRSCYKASHKEKIKIMCLVNYFTHCFCNLWTEPMAEGYCHQLMAIFEYIYICKISKTSGKTQPLTLTSDRPPEAG